MARFGKCKVEGCGGEITHVSWGTHLNGEGCDAIGVCRKCNKEYPLEYVGRNMYLTLKKEVKK